MFLMLLCIETDLQVQKLKEINFIIYNDQSLSKILCEKSSNSTFLFQKLSSDVVGTTTTTVMRQKLLYMCLAIYLYMKKFVVTQLLDLR